MRSLLFILLVSFGAEIHATTTPLNGCLNNLRQIDGAKEQAALELKLSPTNVIEFSAIRPYIKGEAMPKCPAGGTYTLGRVNEFPTCSFPDHSQAGAARLVQRQKRFTTLSLLAIGSIAFFALWLIVGSIVVRNRHQKTSAG